MRINQKKIGVNNIKLTVLNDGFFEIRDLYLKAFGTVERDINDLKIINKVLAFNNLEVIRFDTNIEGTTLFFIISKVKISKVFENNSKSFYDFCYANCESWYGLLDEVAEVYHEEMKAILEKLLLEKSTNLEKGGDKKQKIKL